MKKYDVVSVLWRDHLGFNSMPLVKNPEEEIDKLTLSIGILYKETENVLMIISDVEPHSDVDNCNYVLILKSAIVATQTYGKIELRKLRR